jgi:hypothetical protein
VGSQGVQKTRRFLVWSRQSGAPWQIKADLENGLAKNGLILKLENRADDRVLKNPHVVIRLVAQQKRLKE